MAYDFSGKRALVTGAGGGIGKGIARHLASIGAEVFALSKTKAHLDDLKAECPNIQTICVNLEDWTATRDAVSKVIPIHLLVNNAGVGLADSLLEANPEDFDKSFNVNVKAVMNVTQVVAADLIGRKENGCIVNVSSICGQMALRDRLVYSGTKGALNMFTKVMALELGPKGIRCNAVSPTVVKTNMGRRIWADPKVSQVFLNRIPQGRFATVHDVVNTVMFLLSDNSDMVNGHILPVEGGTLSC